MKRKLCKKKLVRTFFVDDKKVLMTQVLFKINFEMKYFYDENYVMNKNQR